VIRGIEKAHNGAIRVFEDPERGTQFNVYLPVLKDATEGPRGSSMISDEYRPQKEEITSSKTKAALPLTFSKKRDSGDVKPCRHEKDK
jgi:hypothetical protein